MVCIHIIVKNGTTIMQQRDNSRKGVDIDRVLRPSSMHFIDQITLQYQEKETTKVMIQYLLHLDLVTHIW
jgi:hypothetical protein